MNLGFDNWKINERNKELNLAIAHLKNALFTFYNEREYFEKLNDIKNKLEEYQKDYI